MLLLDVALAKSTMKLLSLVWEFRTCLFRWRPTEKCRGCSSAYARQCHEPMILVKSFGKEGGLSLTHCSYCICYVTYTVVSGFGMGLGRLRDTWHSACFFTRVYCVFWFFHLNNPCILCFFPLEWVHICCVFSWHPSGVEGGGLSHVFRAIVAKGRFTR